MPLPLQYERPTPRRPGWFLPAAVLTTIGILVAGYLASCAYVMSNFPVPGDPSNTQPATQPSLFPDDGLFPDLVDSRPPGPATMPGAERSDE